MSSVQRARKTTKPAFTCSFIAITVEISDHRYSVDLLPASPDHVKGWRLTKHSARDSASHDVCLFAEGEIVCTCKSYEMTHAGTSSMCKHARALVALGLLPSPATFVTECCDCGGPLVMIPTCDHWDSVVRIEDIREADVIRDDEVVACCSLGEAEPCVGCAEVISTHEAAPVVAECVCPTCQDVPADDPLEWRQSDDGGWDLEPAPAEPAPIVEECGEPDKADDDGWDDEHTWNTTEPTAKPLDWTAEAVAREHLNRSRTMTLAELVEHQVEHFQSWGNAAGQMLANAMDELALKVRLTGSQTPREYRDRAADLDADVREDWERIGRDSCSCHREPAEPELTGAGRWA